MPEDGKPKSPEGDPDELTRLLDLELMQKRAAWKQADSRHRAIKTASFLFLFLIILAALAGFFLVFSRITEERSQHSSHPAASPP